MTSNPSFLNTIPSSVGAASSSASHNSSAFSPGKISSSSGNHKERVADISKAIAVKVKRHTFNVEVEQLISILEIPIPTVPDVSLPQLSLPLNHIQGQASLLEFFDLGASKLGYPHIKFIDVGARSIESDADRSKDKPDIVVLQDANGQLTWDNVAISGEYKPKKGEASVAEHQTRRYLRKILQAQPGIDVSMSFMVCGTQFSLYYVNASAILKVGPIDMTNDTGATLQCLGIICSFVIHYPRFPLSGRIKSDLSNIPYCFSQLEPIFAKDSVMGSRTYVFSANESAKRVICKSVWLPDYLITHEFDMIKKLNRDGLEWGVPDILWSGALDQSGPTSVTWVDSQHRHLVRYRQISIFQEDRYRTLPPHLIENQGWTTILAGLADVIRALFLSWKLSHIHHRDISVNNVIFACQQDPALLRKYYSQINQCNIFDIPKRQPLGILIDWGNSRQHNVKRGDPSDEQGGQDEISGTLPFMSQKQINHMIVTNSALVGKLYKVAVKCLTAFGNESELDGQDPKQRPQLFQQATREWSHLFQSAVSAYDEAFVTLFELYPISSDAG